MLSPIKFLSICFFLSISLADTAQVQAQMTYELGPFIAIGTGQTAVDAEENAWRKAWDIVVSMAEVIPDDHEIIEFVIERERLVTNNTYVLEFHLVVQYFPIPPIDEIRQSLQ